MLVAMLWTPAPIVRRHLRGHDACVVVERLHDTTSITTGYTESHKISQQSPVAEKHTLPVPASPKAPPEAQLLDKAVFTCLKSPPHRGAHEGR